MPTPRQHGGAALASIPLVVPGFKGLNTAQKSGILGPEWATSLENAVIDNNSRVAARLGWDSVTSVPAADAFTQLHSHLTHAGVERIIAPSATKIYGSYDTGSTWLDLTGSVVATAGNWQFANFNNAVYGIQQGEALIKSTSGAFAVVGGGSIPSGNALLSAYGRLWASDSDGVSLRYSALLAGDDFSGSDAGVQDMTNIWPGTDTIVALAAFNGSLVVFGKDNIVVYTDPQGTALGIDPTQMVVADIITGTGCIARDSVQSIDGDLWFLSKVGLQSLGRLLVQKSNPINNLSRNVHDELARRVAAADTLLDTLRSVYSPLDKLYLLSIPVSGGRGGVVAFDTRAFLEDGAARCVGIWSLFPLAITRMKNNAIIMAINESPGEVGVYSGNVDNGEQYIFNYESGWLDLTKEGYLLIVKRLTGTFYTDGSTAVNYKWAFDFSDSFFTAQRAIVGGGNSSEFGIAEFGIAEFGGGVTLRSSQTPGSGTGQFVKLGISAPILGQSFSIQQINVFCKIGRLI